MRKSTKYIVPTIIFVLLCCIFLLLYRAWCNVAENGYHSCVASIASGIQKLNATKNLAGNNKDWKILNETEVNSLMSQVHGYDCGGVDNQALDLWNNRINIALRKPADRVEVIVWSDGADEISGSEDDLVIPYGEKVP